MELTPPPQVPLRLNGGMLSSGKFIVILIFNILLVTIASVQRPVYISCQDKEEDFSISLAPFITSATAMSLYLMTR
jgi:hypothetical protein